VATAAVTGRWARPSVTGFRTTGFLTIRLLTTTFLMTTLVTTTLVTTTLVTTSGRRRPAVPGSGVWTIGFAGTGPLCWLAESFAQVAAERRGPVGPIFSAATGCAVPVADRPRSIDRRSVRPLALLRATVVVIPPAGAVLVSAVTIPARRTGGAVGVRPYVIATLRVTAGSLIH